MPCTCIKPGRYARYCGRYTGEPDEPDGPCPCTCHPTVVTNISGGKFCDVFIGRESAVALAPGALEGLEGLDGYFGNPFILNIDGNREDVIAMFEIFFYQRIAEDKEYRDAIHALHGKLLGCFCAPEACHGNIIADYLNKKFATQLPMTYEK